MYYNSFPKVAFIKVRYTENTFYEYGNLKINNHITFPKFTADELIQGHNNKACTYTYNIHAAVVHSGEPSFGHYVCYVKKLGQWFVINDSYVDKGNNPSDFGRPILIIYVRERNEKIEFFRNYDRKRENNLYFIEPKP